MTAPTTATGLAPESERVLAERISGLADRLEETLRTAEAMRAGVRPVNSMATWPGVRSQIAHWTIEVLEMVGRIEQINAESMAIYGLPAYLCEGRRFASEHPEDYEGEAFLTHAGQEALWDAVASLQVAVVDHTASETAQSYRRTAEQRAALIEAQRAILAEVAS